jgi:outer membrane protein
MVDFPDYRGANERTNLLLPFPFLVYRGDVLKVDRDGIRGLFLKSDAVELDLSGGASVPVDSDKNQARQGMPDLDGTVEIGPTVDITLSRAPDGRSSLKLHLPVRAVIATDFTHAKGAGFVFQPKLNLDVHRVVPLQGWRAGVSVGPLFADHRYHDYYYSVDPAFATPQRPAYAARGGYGGTQLTLSTSRRFPRFWVGAFARYDWLEGAVFANSPLVRQDRAFSAGIAVAWVFGRSSTLVEADE